MAEVQAVTGKSYTSSSVSSNCLRFCVCLAAGRVFQEAGPNEQNAHEHGEVVCDLGTKSLMLEEETVGLSLLSSLSDNISDNQ